MNRPMNQADSVCSTCGHL